MRKFNIQTIYIFINTRPYPFTYAIFFSMNSFLVCQYTNLVQGRPLESFQCPHHETAALERQLAFIPKAHLLGTPPNAIPLVVSMADRIAALDPDVVVDIGSGKGYLSRLLANFQGLRVLCVDAINERLKSTIRWDRLINDGRLAQTHAVIGNRACISSNIKTLNLKLDSVDDLRGILKEAHLWSTSISKPPKMVISALKNCGNMIYDLVHYYSTLSSSQLGLIVMPCCYHKITDFPRSKQLQTLPIGLDVYESIPDTIYILDMMLYTLNLGLSVAVNYEFDGYYSFTIEI